MTIGPIVRRALGELGWWLRGLVRLGWRAKWWLVLWSLVLLVGANHGHLWVALTPAAPIVVLACWRRCHPASFARLLTAPLWRRRVTRQVRREWAGVMVGCGLTRRDPTGSTTSPALRSLRWDRQGSLWITPALLVGQTVEDLEGAADRVRTALGAHRLRVVPDHSHTRCQLVCTFGDHLAMPFLATLPNRRASTAVAPEQLVIGRTEDGHPWAVDLRVCTLTAGSSGAGKGSVMWSLMLGLAPAIRGGLVEVHGVDLKGGMELGLGRALFTRYADRPDKAVALLEDAVAACEQRATSMAGVTRLHNPTAAAPLVLVLIDELASLTAYVPDRDLLRRGEVALARLCSIGRAPGYVVWGFLQDPRKETVKARHLFTQTIGLRLRDREESAMVLGDGATAAGAACHRISRGAPGVGFALDEAGRLTQVRAGWVPDEAIRDVAAAFPAPRQDPVVVREGPASTARARGGSRGVAA